MGNSIMMMTSLWDCLIFIMGIPILVKWHVDIEMVQALYIFLCFMLCNKQNYKRLQVYIQGLLIVASWCQLPHIHSFIHCNMDKTSIIFNSVSWIAFLDYTMPSLHPCMMTCHGNIFCFIGPFLLAEFMVSQHSIYYIHSINYSCKLNN